MAVENTNILDAFYVDAKTEYLNLIIIDSLEWEEKNHLYMLQEKINYYLACVEGGALIEAHPNFKGRKVIFKLIAQYPPNEAAQNFLSQVKTTIEGAGFGFVVEVPEK